MDKKKILVADASEEFRRLFVGAVSGEHDMVLAGETSDGQETVDLARETGPDVVVMDLVLSRMEGMEVLKELSTLSPRPRILVLSGFARGNVADTAAQLGADYCMMKPCKTSSVLECIRRLTDQIPADGEDIREGTRGQSLESTVTAIIMRLGYPLISRAINTCGKQLSLRWRIWMSSTQ